MSALDSNAGVDLYCPTCERTFAVGERCPADNTRLVRIARRGDQMIGRELDGRYTVVAELGQGAMGTVYRGTQHSVGREVAIKVVNANLMTESNAIKRFLREAKLASRLAHPNAVSVLDFGQTDDGMFYLVMELVAGRTLDKVLETERALTPPRVVRIGAQICDALEGAHALDIIHRDLKPANVMIMSTGRDLVKVLDFGLAKSLSPDSSTATMTNAGALIGTPAYMPPELVTGEPVDARADLYSLGCILYQAAAGRPPFTATSVHELIALHASEKPPPLTGLPRRLVQVIEKLLAKSPADRYQTAAQARETLEAALATDSGPVAAVPEAIDPTIVSAPQTILGWSGLNKSGDLRRSAPIPQAIPASNSGPIAQRPRAQTPPAGVASRPMVEMAALRPSTPAGGVPRAMTPPAGIPHFPQATPLPQSFPPLQPAPIPMQPRPAKRAKPTLVIGAVVVLGISAIAAYWIVGRTSRASTSAPTSSPSPSPSSGAVSNGAVPSSGVSNDAVPTGSAPNPTVPNGTPPTGSSNGTAPNGSPNRSSGPMNRSSNGTAPKGSSNNTTPTPSSGPPNGSSNTSSATAPSRPSSPGTSNRPSATQAPERKQQAPSQPVLVNPGPGM